MYSFKDFYLLKEDKSPKYGCLMAFFKRKDAEQFEDYGSRYVEKDNLSNDGVEDEAHVTIAYGWTGKNILPDLKKFLKGYGTLTCKTQEVSRFKNDEHDVLKVEVESSNMKKLHNTLKKEFKDRLNVTFPEWKGHVTLAYVKKGTQEQLDGDDRFKGLEFTFNELIYSTPGRTKTRIKL